MDQDTAASGDGDRRPGPTGAAVAALDAGSAGGGRRGKPPDGGQRRAGRGEPQRGDAAADQRRARRRTARAGRATAAQAGEGHPPWRGRRPVEQRVRWARGAGGRHRTAGRGRAVGLDPGPGRPARERGPHAGHQGARAGPAGHDHGRGRGPVGHPRCRRRGRVPRRRGARLRQSGHAAGEVLPGRLRAGRGVGSPGRRPPMPDARHARGVPRRRLRSTPRCSRCGPTTAPCWWPSTGSSPARATRRATRCSRRRRPPPARRSDAGRWSSSRTWPHGGRRTGRSAPNRNAPATAWRRSCAVRRPGCRA